MTALMQTLIDRLQQVPSEEQDAVAARLMEDLPAAHAAQPCAEEEGEIEPYASFKFLQEADLDLPPDASVTYERALYGRTEDLE